MKRYLLRDWNVEKIIKQNAADYIDVLEGCLLDDLFLYTKRGYMLLLETYANSNSSIYTMIFSTDIKEIDAIWNKRRAAYEAAVYGN